MKKLININCENEGFRPLSGFLISKYQCAFTKFVLNIIPGFRPLSGFLISKFPIILATSDCEYRFRPLSGFLISKSRPLQPLISLTQELHLRLKVILFSNHLLIIPHNSIFFPILCHAA